jgi:hypothetical protein
MHILFILQTAFSIWMVVDAIRRGASQYWWLIIMVPFGEVAYFIAIVLPDLRRNGTLKRLFTRPPTLAQLEQAFEETPSHHNRLLLARALHDDGQFPEAGVLFEGALAVDALDRDALYGFAQCAFTEGEVEAAIGALETLVDVDMGYLDSVPATELAEVYWESEREEKALALAETLCRKSQRVGPRVLMARYLIDLSREGEAAKLLRKGLASYASSPAYVRRRDRKEARTAKAMLRAL